MPITLVTVALVWAAVDLGVLLMVSHFRSMGSGRGCGGLRAFATPIALRTLEERARMLAEMARQTRERGQKSSTDVYESRRVGSLEHTDRIRRVLARRSWDAT